MKNPFLNSVFLISTFSVLVGFTAIAGENRLKFGNEAFKKGDKVINLGIGVGSPVGYGGGIPWPALSISYEQGIINDLGPGNLGVGAFFGLQYTSYNYGLSGSKYKSNWTDVFFGGRAAYHYNFNLDKKFDPYAGVLIGGRIQSYTDNSNIKNDNYGGFFPWVGLFVGARYQFVNSLGCFAEMGRGVNFLTFGIDLKF